MKILFTGASSFTGYWIVKELVASGHQVTAVFQHPMEKYSGLRKTRVDALKEIAEPVFACPFGSDAFLQVIQTGGFDLLCHHASFVVNYKSMEFDYNYALKNNTHNIEEVMKAFVGSGGQKVILTGTVFEPGEGGGETAMYPYGLSKGLTWQVFSYYCRLYNLELAKFVVPAPFGVYEKEGLASYLMKSWMRKEVPVIKTPEYVRDHIPVELLARSYSYLIEQNLSRMAPKGFSESVGDFTKRLSQHLDMPCEYVLNEQTEFSEPKVRVNTDTLTMPWDEKSFWKRYTEYYQETR